MRPLSSWTSVCPKVKFKCTSNRKKRTWSSFTFFVSFLLFVADSQSLCSVFSEEITSHCKCFFKWRSFLYLFSRLSLLVTVFVHLNGHFSAWKWSTAEFHSGINQPIISSLSKFKPAPLSAAVCCHFSEIDATLLQHIHLQPSSWSAPWGRSSSPIFPFKGRSLCPLISKKKVPDTKTSNINILYVHNK